jgi:hypothetical protein
LVGAAHRRIASILLNLEPFRFLPPRPIDTTPDRDPCPLWRCNCPELDVSSSIGSLEYDLSSVVRSNFML